MDAAGKFLAAQRLTCETGWRLIFLSGARGGFASSDTVEDMNGVELSRLYYESIVAPLLEQYNGGIAHAAGRLGTGSDVLGFDDDMSRDHDWGMRLTLLVESASLNGLSDYLDARLPDKVHGHPTRFSLSNDPTIRHRIDIDTAERFTAERLGFDATSRINALEWLATSSQSILEVTTGPVFADTIGTLTEIRRRLRWYPDDVWRYVVATSWARLAEELPLMSRAGIRGDELGASIIAARLVGVAMRLGFQLERTWAPYPKWFGAAFAALPRASACGDQFAATLRARSWQERQHHLAAACEHLYAFQRSTALPTIPGPVLEPFHDRPFFTVRQAAINALMPPDSHVGVGSVDQWSDNVAVLTAPQRRLAATRALHDIE